MPFGIHDALPLEAIMKIIVLNTIGMMFVGLLFLASLLGHDTCVEILDAIIK